MRPALTRLGGHGMKRPQGSSVRVILTEGSQPQNDRYDDDTIAIPYNPTAVDLEPTK
jgi:hypothetical protein